jgi:hypothetical protein
LRPFVASDEFDNLVVMCATFPGQRPSQVARPLLEPDLAVKPTELDWYAFDVACAARWQEMQSASVDGSPAVDTSGQSAIPRPQTPQAPPAPARNGPLVEEGGGAFRLIGDEIPPWQQ